MCCWIFLQPEKERGFGCGCFRSMFRLIERRGWGWSRPGGSGKLPHEPMEGQLPEGRGFVVCPLLCPAKFAGENTLSLLNGAEEAKFENTNMIG
ncbi:MAG: hypothetical protein V8Q76_13170 [Bacteroides intestinalis]